MARGNIKKKGKGGQGQNRKASEGFLTKNRVKDGVIETTSGLQYKITDKGEGNSPDERSIITVHQRITLIDGTIIRDTYKEIEPEQFDLTEGIDGLKEGIPLMSKGARYKFWVPSELAWGKRGAGDKIGPNAILVFDIKLIDFY